MKTLSKHFGELLEARRWDIDFHLPPEHIKKFDDRLLVEVSEVADIGDEKRDPTKKPDEAFTYIDIASIDVETGEIVTPQDLTGEEAPSRARKVVSAFDVIVSTCRPTRGAIALVPVEFHNQIASTAFSVVRAKDGVNPYYLQFALRLESTREQFRKWSTGSSYPAILDEDVEKTLIPVPDLDIQNAIAAETMRAFLERKKAIEEANTRWEDNIASLTNVLTNEGVEKSEKLPHNGEAAVAYEAVKSVKAELPTLASDMRGRRRRAQRAAQGDLIDALA